MKNALKHILLPPQIYEELLRRIWSAEYPVHTQLPSVSKLTAEFNVGKHSIEEAVAMLANDGYLKRHRGRAPLIVMPAGKKILRLAATGMNTTAESQMDYVRSPRRWLFKESVLQGLRQHNCHCAGVFDRSTLEKTRPMLDGIIHFEFLDKPHNPAPELGIPVLTVKNMLENELRPNTVYTDRDRAVEKSAYYLISHGIKSILSLQRGNDVLHNEREKLLLRTLADSGSQDIPLYSAVTEGIREKNAVAPLKAFLAQKPELPVGILAQGDLLAKGAAQTALDCGLQLKKDIVIIGCTGLPEAANWHPAVTSLTSPFSELGKRAAETIIKLIETGQDQPPQIVYGQLIIRET